MFFLHAKELLGVVIPLSFFLPAKEEEKRRMCTCPPSSSISPDDHEFTRVKVGSLCDEAIILARILLNDRCLWSRFVGKFGYYCRCRLRHCHCWGALYVRRIPWKTTDVCDGDLSRFDGQRHRFVVVPPAAVECCCCCCWWCICCLSL